MPIQFAAYDKDVASSDFLGATNSLMISDWIVNKELNIHDIPLHELEVRSEEFVINKAGKTTGNLTIAT